MAMGSSAAAAAAAATEAPVLMPQTPPSTTTHHHHILSYASNPTIILITVAVSIVALIATSALVFTSLCRQKSSSRKRRPTDEEEPPPSNNAAIDVGFAANKSPDVRSCSITGGASLSFPKSLIKNRNRVQQVFRYKALEIATDGFCRENVIGFGGFGTVYRGVLGDGTVAAIKMLNREGKQGEREFRIEVDLLSRLHSPYLVGLLGYCADQQHRLLVFEFMANGSLRSHLHATSHNHQHQEPLGWGTRLQIALDCARALEFLHEYTSPSVIHRDFKCSNILLDANLRAKVSDFGMAKLGSDKLNGQVVTRVLGTKGYVAPEYASTGKLTTKSDVYGYGVVLLELLTGRLPVDMKRPPGEQILVSWVGCSCKYFQ